jgi:hypothetical protein
MVNVRPFISAPNLLNGFQWILAQGRVPEFVVQFSC